MEIREIRVFLVLAEELHFGRTAERLYLSQTRVSQTVRALEGRLGGRLFERTSRRVRLTPLGERLLPVHPPSIDSYRTRSSASRCDERIGLDGPTSVIHREAQ